MWRLWITALIFIVGCDSAAQKWQQTAALRLNAAQLQWNDCADDPGCKGDDMLKSRMQLQDAQADYDRASLEVQAQWAAIMHSY